MKVKNRRHTNDHLTFPSGRTIKRCKDDAKKLRKDSKNTDDYIGFNQALNIIAKKNGLDMNWNTAVNLLITQSQQPEVESKSLYNWLSGKVKNKQSHSKKEVCRKFKSDGKLMLPNGEGGIIEVFPHNQDKKGVLITKTVSDLIEADIQQLGGLQSLKGYDEGCVQLFYYKPNSNSHLAYEFHINRDGVVYYFCRSRPWEGYAAELHVRGYEITSTGHDGSRPTDTALHWVGFSYFHKMLEVKVL